MTGNEERNRAWEPIKEPLTLERKQNKLPFLIGFAVFLGLWMFVAGCAFNNGIVDTDKSNQQNNHGIDPTSFLDTKYIILVFTLLSACWSLIYIILSKRSSKAVLNLSTFCIIAFGIFCTCAHIMYFGRNKSVIFYWIITAVAALISGTAICMFLQYRLNSNDMMQGCELVQVMTTIVLYAAKTLLVPIIQCILYVILAIFSMSVMIYLSAYPKDEDNPHLENLIRLFHVINFFGFFWTILFINGFGQMILAGTFMTWLWSKDEESVPKFTMLRYIYIIVRYHLGKIAYESLIAIGLTCIRVLFNFIPKYCIKNDRLFKNTEKFLDRYDTLTSNYMICIIYGTKFHHLMHDNLSRKFKNIRADVTIQMEQYIVIGVSTLIVHLYCQSKPVEGYKHYAAFASVAVLATMTTWAFSTIVKVARDTLYWTMNEFSKAPDDYRFDPVLFRSDKVQVLVLKLKDINSRN